LIIQLDINQKEYHHDIAKLVHDAFPWTYTTPEEALYEALSLLKEDYLLFGYLYNELIIGIVGARPQYGITGWELHPLIVDRDFRGQKIATQLMGKIEDEVRHKGGIVMYLGSDDEHNRTSLSNVDLFENTFEAIKQIKNLRNHPYGFYEKINYQIVGVIPDANGFDKPDILMAKRLVDRPKSSSD